ncbi:MAG: glycoside hydrolase domain-containing protein, partial [bacterium]
MRTVKILLIVMFFYGYTASLTTKTSKLLVDKPSGDTRYTIWAESPMVPVYYLDKPAKENEPDSLIELYAASNEYIPFQLIIYPNSNLDSIWVQFEPLVGPSTIAAADFSFNKVGYVTILDKKSEKGEARCIPEVLLHNKQITLKPKANNPVWVTLKVPENTLPGTYLGSLWIMQGRARLQQIKINLRVCNFSLPRVPSIRSMHDPIQSIPSLGREEEYYYSPLSDIKSPNLKSHIADELNYFTHDTRKTEQIIDDYIKNVHEHRMDLEYLNPQRPRVRIKGDKIKVYFDEWAQKVKPQVERRAGLYFTIPTFLGVGHDLFNWYGLEVLSPEFKKVFTDFCAQISEGLTKWGWKKQALLHFWNEIRDDNYARLGEVCRLAKAVDPELLCFTSSHADRCFDSAAVQAGLDT